MATPFAWVGISCSHGGILLLEPLGLAGLVSSGVAFASAGGRRRRRLALSPQEEVPVSHSQRMQGLQIAEKAG